MRILRIAIVDDEPNDLDHLRDVIETYTETREMPVEIDAFLSGGDFLKAFQPGKYELIFFDNYIGNGLGIDFARKARAQDEEVEFVFVSMSPEFAVSGFEVRALHYLIKPATPEEIAKVFDRFWKHVPRAEEPMIAVTSERRPILVPVRSIRFIEVVNKNCIIHADEEITVHMQLEKLLELLPPDEFIRTHRGFSVRLDCIQAMTPSDFLLKSGEKVPIGRAYQNCRSAYIEYFADKRTKKLR
jgi:DNA-binding LytR/AlgR family response regulator